MHALSSFVVLSDWRESTDAAAGAADRASSSPGCWAYNIGIRNFLAGMPIFCRAFTPSFLFFVVDNWLSLAPHTCTKANTFQRDCKKHTINFVGRSTKLDKASGLLHRPTLARSAELRHPKTTSQPHTHKRPKINQRNTSNNS